MARSIVAISGVVLAVAATVVVINVKVLTDPAIIVPIGLAPCLVGVAFAMTGCGPRGLWLGAILLRVIAAAITVSGLSVMVVFPPLGILELLVGLLYLSAVGVGPVTARRCAGIAIACGAVGAIWFLITAGVPFEPRGASLVAAGASFGLLIGGVLWLAQPAAASLPRAIARLAR